MAFLEKVGVEWDFVGDMSFQTFQASHSVGLIEQACTLLDQLPGIMIFGIEDANGPSPHDRNFSGLQTLKLFEAANGSDNLRSRTG